MTYAIIGDVHGCVDELSSLLCKLPKSVFLVFVGDLIDKGPNSIVALNVVRYLCETGRASCVLGNHDDKLRRYLNGDKVKMTPELSKTLRQYDECPQLTQHSIKGWLNSLPYLIKLDNDRLFVSHAGCPDDYQDKLTEKTRSYCLFGKTNGQIDEDGNPVRLNWAKDYRGRRVVVHGHVVVSKPTNENFVYNIDTGCYKTGILTALLYPSMELVTNA